MPSDFEALWRSDRGAILEARSAPRRRELALTQEDLSRLTRTSAGYIAHLEKAKHIPRIEHSSMLAFALTAQYAQAANAGEAKARGVFES